jgi:hypothetical protein
MTEQTPEINEEEIRRMAQRIVARRLTLRVNATALVVVGLLLAVINNYVAPSEYQWWLWAAVPWAAGLALHAFFAYPTSKHTDIGTHLYAYLVVNLLLVFIDWFVAGTITWAVWPAAGWGVLLALHLFFKISHGTKNAAAIHTFVYVVANLFLVLVDLITSPGVTWSLWSVGGWGLGLVFHLVIYSYQRPAAGEDPNQSWVERKAEALLQKELAKQKAQKTATGKTVSGATPVAAPKGAHTCPECGLVNKPEAKFCATCGKPI